MNIILLSGGSGKRLWPLSNDIRSKQFIKIFKGPGRNLESMVQRVYRQIRTVNPNVNITIATSKSQVSMLYNQIGADVAISVEPCRRDTFAAIALATAYLHDVRGIGIEEPVVVCPVDPYVEEDYFDALLKLGQLVVESDATNLILLGIQPSYPSEKYGYIIPKTLDTVSDVETFKEKPNISTAQSYIDQGALWNGGVFAYKLSYVIDKSREIIGYSTYDKLLKNYENLERVSFDYAVVEKEKSIRVIRFAGLWKDIGTWNTLTEAMDIPVVGNGIIGDQCSNLTILNELDVPILAMGMHDVVISASPDGVLVSKLNQSSYIKPYVDDISQPIHFAEKSWGSYRVIDVGEESLTVKVTLNSNHSMNYHSHERRNEVWTVIRGSGKTIIDGIGKIVKVGDVITMAAGCKHTVIAGDEGIQLIEVQIGNEISVKDKRKYNKIK